MTAEDKYTLPEISFTAGENQLFLFALLKEANLPADVSGSQCQFSISDYRHRFSEPLLCIDVNFSLSAEGNVAKIELKPIDTVDLFGKYVYSFSIKKSSIKANIFQGVLNIFENSNKPFLQL